MSAYKQMSDRKLNFLQLSSIEALRKHTHFTTPQTGFNPDIISRLITDSKLESLDYKSKQVCICKVIKNPKC